jgi:hypothetical protein
MYQHFSSQSPSKKSKIGIFGMKINIASGSPAHHSPSEPWVTMVWLQALSKAKSRPMHSGFWGWGRFHKSVSAVSYGKIIKNCKYQAL